LTRHHAATRSAVTTALGVVGDVLNCMRTVACIKSNLEHYFENSVTGNKLPRGSLHGTCRGLDLPVAIMGRNWQPKRGDNVGDTERETELATQLFINVARVREGR
jgi:hypothetical protein